MKSDYDVKLIGQIFLTLVIAFIVGYMFYYMVRMSDTNREKQSVKIKEIVEQAAVQCYALEGSYPEDVYYLEKYGVIFDDSKYIYFYDFMGGNQKPQVTIMPRVEGVSKR